MAPMKVFRTSRRAVALVAAYALALQPLVATLAWATHAAGLVPGQAIICQSVLPGGSDSRGAPTGSDRVCGCCTTAMCGASVVAANLPRSIGIPLPHPEQPVVLAKDFAAVPQVMPSGRYCPRAPPAA
jgi:hypothetical protein